VVRHFLTGFAVRLEEERFRDHHYQLQEIVPLQERMAGVFAEELAIGGKRRMVSNAKDKQEMDGVGEGWCERG